MTWKREEPDRELTVIANLSVTARNILGVTEEDKKDFLEMYNCIKKREVKNCLHCLRCTEQCESMRNGLIVFNKIRSKAN